MVTSALKEVLKKGENKWKRWNKKMTNLENIDTLARYTTVKFVFIVKMPPKHLG